MPLLILPSRAVRRFPRWPYAIDWSHPLSRAQGTLNDGNGKNGALRVHLSWPTEAMMPAELVGEWAPNAIGSGLAASNIAHRGDHRGAIRGINFVTNDEHFYNATGFATAGTSGGGLWAISALLEWPLTGKQYAKLVSDSVTANAPLGFAASNEIGTYRSTAFSGFGIYAADYTGLHRVTVRGGWDASFSGGKRAEMFIDGVQVGVAAANPWHSIEVTTIGNEPNYSLSRDRGFGAIFDIQIWDGVWPDNDWIAQQADDPYANLVEYGRAVYFIPSAGGGTTYNQTVTGSLTPAGAVLKQTDKPLAGSSTPTGGITTEALLGALVVGTITATGALSRATLKALAGGLTPAGTVSKETQRTLSGSVTPAGNVAKQTAKNLAGVITAAGDVAITFAVAVAGTVTATGAVASSYLAGGASSVGVYIRRFWRRFRR